MAQHLVECIFAVMDTSSRLLEGHARRHSSAFGSTEPLPDILEACHERALQMVQPLLLSATVVASKLGVPGEQTDAGAVDLLRELIGTTALRYLSARDVSIDETSDYSFVATKNARTTLCGPASCRNSSPLTTAKAKES